MVIFPEYSVCLRISGQRVDYRENVVVSSRLDAKCRFVQYFEIALQRSIFVTKHAVSCCMTTACVWMQETKFAENPDDMATFRLTRGYLSAALLCAGMLYARPLISQSLYPGQYETRTEIGNEILMKAGCFDLQDVKLLPGRFRENMQRDSAWIVSLGADRLLHSFRTTAGVYAGREGGYMTVRKLGGWESLDCELRGHITGHMMSACALMYASTGSDVFKAKGDSLVTGLADVQKAYADGTRLSPLYDVHRQRYIVYWTIKPVL